MRKISLPQIVLIENMPSDIDPFQTGYRCSEIDTIPHIGHTAHRFIRRPVTAGGRPVLRKSQSQTPCGNRLELSVLVYNAGEGIGVNGTQHPVDYHRANGYLPVIGFASRLQ